MKVKTKGFLTGAIFIVLMALLAILILFVPKGETTASAATAQTTVLLNGTYSQSMWGGGYTRDITDAAVVTATTSLGNTHENVSMSFSLSSSASGKAVLNNKDFINASTVTFTGSQSKYTLTIYDEYSRAVTTGNGSVTATLSFGLYRVILR